MEDDFAQNIFYYLLMQKERNRQNGKFCKSVNCNKKYVNGSRVSGVVVINCKHAKLCMSSHLRAFELNKII